MYMEATSIMTNRRQHIDARLGLIRHLAHADDRQKKCL